MNASVQWQPDGLTIRTEKWFLGAGFLGAPPIFLTAPTNGPIHEVRIGEWRVRPELLF